MHPEWKFLNSPFIGKGPRVPSVELSWRPSHLRGTGGACFQFLLPDVCRRPCRVHPRHSLSPGRKYNGGSLICARRDASGRGSLSAHSEHLRRCYRGCLLRGAMVLFRGKIDLSESVAEFGFGDAAVELASSKTEFECSHEPNCLFSRRRTTTRLIRRPSPNARFTSVLRRRDASPSQGNWEYTGIHAQFTRGRHTPMDDAPQ